MKIIAFPFAGGNKHSFNFLKPHLAEKDFSLDVIEYPGRGEKIRENLLDSMEELVRFIMPMVIEKINNNYVIYGHSMGALVGYLICKEIEEMELNRPIRLVVSGLKPPKYAREKVVSDLSEKEFWKEVSKLGGIPEEVQKSSELMEFFTPILKVDFKCMERYEYNTGTPKLTIPIDVFYGSNEEIDHEEIQGWKDETDKEVTIKELEGDHFFIFNHLEYFKMYFESLN